MACWKRWQTRLLTLVPIVAVRNCVDTFVSTFVDTFVDAFVDACLDMHVRTFLDTCVDMFVNAFEDMCVDTFVDTFVTTLLNTCAVSCLLDREDTRHRHLLFSDLASLSRMLFNMKPAASKLSCMSCTLAESNPCDGGEHAYLKSNASCVTMCHVRAACICSPERAAAHIPSKLFLRGTRATRCTSSALLTLAMSNQQAALVNAVSDKSYSFQRDDRRR